MTGSRTRISDNWRNLHPSEADRDSGQCDSHNLPQGILSDEKNQTVSKRPDQSSGFAILTQVDRFLFNQITMRGNSSFQE
jgi:hypothetical protein